jgi:hypothetical protein
VTFSEDDNLWVQTNVLCTESYLFDFIPEHVRFNEWAHPPAQICPLVERRWENFLDGENRDYPLVVVLVPDQASRQEFQVGENFSRGISEHLLVNLFPQNVLGVLVVVKIVLWHKKIHLFTHIYLYFSDKSGPIGVGIFLGEGGM